MSAENFEIQAKTPFSESLIWQINRDYYQGTGINAWSDNIVPHHMTSNSKVGKTYAELIFAFLKDLSLKGRQKETVYIIELGAGHGRLAFHVLMHLEKLILSYSEATPPYCYVLSDIVENNLEFFSDHSQFESYYKRGILDLAYFDAVGGKEFHLRKANKTISSNDLTQPIIAIANYFFDSLPNELFHVQNKIISECSISINSKEDPKGLSPEKALENMEFKYYKSDLKLTEKRDTHANQVLEEYRNTLLDTYLFFPRMAMACLKNLKDISKEGLMLLTMDKGFHELHNLQDKTVPEIITHGSFSLWVNFHALGVYCEKLGGETKFPSSSNFHLEIGCLMFVKDNESYSQTDAAYEQFVNNFGPDDFNSIKQLAYGNVSQLRFIDIIALIRLSSYDSTFFIKLLPRLKRFSKAITFNERTRLTETMDHVWDMYFNLNEDYDLAYEIGSIFYDLGHYRKTLTYYKHSVDSFGEKADTFYNQALCHYQLKEDKMFYEVLANGKKAFPNFELFKKLDKLDMS